MPLLTAFEEADLVNQWAALKEAARARFIRPHVRKWVRTKMNDLEDANIPSRIADAMATANHVRDIDIHIGVLHLPILYEQKMKPVRLDPEDDPQPLIEFVRTTRADIGYASMVNWSSELPAVLDYEGAPPPAFTPEDLHTTVKDVLKQNALAWLSTHIGENVWVYKRHVRYSENVEGWVEEEGVLKKKSLFCLDAVELRLRFYPYGLPQPLLAQRERAIATFGQPDAQEDAIPHIHEWDGCHCQEIDV